MDKKILIVDDEREITDLLEVYLGSEGYVVYKFYCGVDAWNFIRQEKVDLAILDVMLPDMDGFTLCRKIREAFYFPIIMLTAKTWETDKVNGILLGADDYMTKPFQPLELLARVKGQLRRAEQYNKALSKDEKETYEIRGLEVNVDLHSAILYGEKLELTPTEFSILLYLCRHMNQVVTSEEIFEQVWKEKFLDSNNTVFTHVSRIREKMHENARHPKFIKTVWGVGYKLEGSRL
ncbi:MAG: VanR-ABDEGLN family response regulator transcription factor [Lachnospiraceae bacterium]|nr:VanR-ABDEGLN family response regulator transcription factor [Lachnospiraceae bacterium]